MSVCPKPVARAQGTVREPFHHALLHMALTSSWLPVCRPGAEAWGLQWQPHSDDYPQELLGDKQGQQEEVAQDLEGRGAQPVGYIFTARAKKELRI